MMKIGEETRKAIIVPILISRGGVRFVPTDVEHSPASQIGLASPRITRYRAVLSIRNIGEGAAIFMTSWSQPVSESFNTGSALILTRTAHATMGNQELTELFKGEAAEVSFAGFQESDLNRRWLFVVDAIDQANGKHQLQVLRLGNPDGEEIKTMVHGPGDSLGERVEKMVNRCVEILNAVIRAFGKLGK